MSAPLFGADTRHVDDSPPFPAARRRQHDPPVHASGPALPAWRPWSGGPGPPTRLGAAASRTRGPAVSRRPTHALGCGPRPKPRPTGGHRERRDSFELLLELMRPAGRTSSGGPRFDHHGQGGSAGPGARGAARDDRPKGRSAGADPDARETALSDDQAHGSATGSGYHVADRGTPTFQCRTVQGLRTARRGGSGSTHHSGGAQQLGQDRARPSDPVAGRRAGSPGRRRAGTAAAGIRWASARGDLRGSGDRAPHARSADSPSPWPTRTVNRRSPPPSRTSWRRDERPSGRFPTGGCSTATGRWLRIGGGSAKPPNTGFRSRVHRPNLDRWSGEGCFPNAPTRLRSGSPRRSAH